MTHLEKRLIGLLFWQTHTHSKESEIAATELLTQLELNQAGGGENPGIGDSFAKV